MRALADPRVIIVATVGDDRPAVIFAGLRDVDLIAAARAVFDGPQLARGRIERGALHVAVPDRPDLRPPAVLFGITRIGASIGHQAHEFAEVIARVLRLLAGRIALTQRHEQRTVRGADDARAKMHARGIGGLLTEDHRDLIEARAIALGDEFGPCHAG